MLSNIVGRNYGERNNKRENVKQKTKKVLQSKAQLSGKVAEVKLLKQHHRFGMNPEAKTAEMEEEALMNPRAEIATMEMEQDKQVVLQDLSGISNKDSNTENEDSSDEVSVELDNKEHK